MSEAIFGVATTMSIRPWAGKSKRGEKLIKFIKINQRNWGFWTRLAHSVWAIWRRGTSEWVISQFTPLMNLCHDFSLNFHVTSMTAALPQSQHNFSILILISFLHSILLFHYITLHTMSGILQRLKGENRIKVSKWKLPLISQLSSCHCCAAWVKSMIFSVVVIYSFLFHETFNPIADTMARGEKSFSNFLTVSLFSSSQTECGDGECV